MSVGGSVLHREAGASQFVALGKAAPGKRRQFVLDQPSRMVDGIWTLANVFSSMDELHIEIVPRPWKLGSTEGQSLPYGGGAVAVIHVNSEPLVELVRRVELPSACADDQEGLAGSYRPLWGYRFDPDLFFGCPSDPELRRPNGVVLMGCDCGVVGCWPLECRVRIEGDTIIWDRFRQPFRPRWDHSGLGPFIFDRAAYEAAVKDAGARFMGLVGRSSDQQRNYEERVRVMRGRYPKREWPDWPTVSGITDSCC